MVCSELGNNINWYVLFCRTGFEEKLSKILNYYLGKDLISFVPKKTFIFRRHGHKSLFQKICFPGYVFIKTNLNANEFIIRSISTVYKQKNAYRFLNYGNKSDIVMRKDEIQLINGILDKDNNIDLSTALKEGDFIKITSGPLVNNESMITKINSKRNIAYIEIDIFGRKVPVSVGINIIKKI